MAWDENQPHPGRRRWSEGRYSENSPLGSRHEDFAGWSWSIKPNPSQFDAYQIRGSPVSRGYCIIQLLDRELSLLRVMRRITCSNAARKNGSPIRYGPRLQLVPENWVRKLGQTSCEIAIRWTQLRLRQVALGSVFSERNGKP